MAAQVGIEGNEVADQLTKESIDNANEEIDNRIFQADAQKPWFDRSKLDIAHIQIINSLMSNNSYDRRWVHRFNKVTSELSSKPHLVFQCSNFETTRMSFHSPSKLKNTEDLWRSDDREKTKIPKRKRYQLLTNDRIEVGHIQHKNTYLKIA